MRARLRVSPAPLEFEVDTRSLTVEHLGVENRHTDSAGGIISDEENVLSRRNATLGRIYI